MMVHRIIYSSTFGIPGVVSMSNDEDERDDKWRISIN
jgi:hypothetical protein